MCSVRRQHFLCAIIFLLLLAPGPLTAAPFSRLPSVRRRDKVTSADCGAKKAVRSEKDVLPPPPLQLTLHRRRKSQSGKHSGDEKSHDEEDVIPRTLRPWLKAYHAAPQGLVFFPLSDVDITFTLFAALVMTCIDYGAARCLPLFGWPTSPFDEKTRAGAGSVAAIIHGTALCLGLVGCLSTQRFRPSEKMSKHPRWWIDGATALLQCCTGYMIYDAAIQYGADKWVAGEGLVYGATDWMFLGHHGCTALYMMSVRLVGAGHMSAMWLMLLGECTAPIMNVLRLAKTVDGLGCWGWLVRSRPQIEFVFAAPYVMLRAVMGPCVAIYNTIDLLGTKQGRANVPVGLSIFWLAMAWAVLFGSIPWISNAWNILCRGKGGADPA